MNPFYPEIKKNFGFGMMRLPMVGEDVDIPQTCDMVDAFLAAGFNYFDTAHPYIQGKSEEAIKACLTSRYPRDAYILTDKLTSSCFESEGDIRPLIDAQLDACGVEYFDFILLHAVSSRRYPFYQQTHAFEVLQALKAQGKTRHVGMSFHDTADVLDDILTQHPEIEVVQLQLNYVDWEDNRVQSHACYDVCVKHGKPVIVMEPVKGGSLVNLPQEATALMTSGSPASYAVRFAASHENVMMVLSGMSDRAQMADNVSYMRHFQPLTQEEMGVIDRVRTIYQGLHRIPCTACRYCTDGCPAGIPIPDVFAAFNAKMEKKEETAYAALEHNASDCLKCGKCEKICPQKLHIRELLEAVAKAF